MCCSPWGRKESYMTEGLNWQLLQGFPGGSDGKRICLQCRGPRFNPWVLNIPWRREWLPIPVFLTGEFHGQRNLAGYGPWDCRESDTTEQLTLSTLYYIYMGFPGGSDGKESPCNAGDLGSVSGSGRSPGGGLGSPVQYSYLENPMDRGAWQAGAVTRCCQGWKRQP